MDSSLLSAFFADLHTPPSVKTSWEEVYDEMIVHTRGAKPVKLIGEYRPNEPQDIFDYRMDVYEPITQDAINRGIDSLYRIISESNYHITLSSNIADYIKQTHFTPDSYNDTSEAMSFISLMIKYIIRVDIDDPNGALVWMPVNEAGGEPLANPTNKEIGVKPVIVNSKHIYHSSKEAFGWMAKKVWLYEDSKGNEKAAPFFYLITKEDIHRIIPIREARTGDPEDRVYEGVLYQEELYYSLLDTSGKPADMLPRVIFGGNTVLNEEGYYYYQSYFSGFVSWGNEAIRAFSDNQAVRVRANFPVPEEKGQKCVTCKGAGVVKAPNSTANVECGTCGGFGYVPSKGPYSTYISQPPTGGESESYALKPAIQWHSPQVDILRESFTTWEKFIDKAERAINIKFPDEAQSGVAKEIDRDKLYDMLIKFSENLFNNIIAKSLHIIEAYRVPSFARRQESVVNPPNSFDIKSQKDLMEEMKELSNSSAPTPFISNVAKQLAGRIFHGDKITIKIIEVQSEYDPFFNRPFTELISYQSAGQLSKEAIPRHNYAYQILREIADEKKDAFLNMSFSEIKAIADEKLVAYIPIQAQTENVNFQFDQLIAEANTPVQ